MKKILANVGFVCSLVFVLGCSKPLPWVERACTAASSTSENSKEAIAGTIVGFTHPTAEKPTMDSYEVSKNGDIVEILYRCNFRGGFTGGHYHLQLKWRFSEQQNFGIQIVSDDALTGIEPGQMKKLEEYFQTEMYPIVLGNVR